MFTRPNLGQSHQPRRRPPPSFLTTPNLPSVGLRDLFGPSFGPAPSELNDLVQQFPELGIRFRFLPELAVGSSELEPQVRYSVFRRQPLTSEEGNFRSYGLPVIEAKGRHENVQGLRENQALSLEGSGSPAWLRGAFSSERHEPPRPCG